jgi:hypothetical protein
MPKHPIMWLGVALVAVVLAQSAIVPSNSTGDPSWPYQAYKTVNYTPPYLAISQPRGNSSAGYLFFAPDGATDFEMAPLIMDASGELIWNGPDQHAFGFRVQMYHGEEVLVAWNGTLYAEPVGRGNGVIHIWNKHYQQIAEVSLRGNFKEQVVGAAYPSNIDVHEIFITMNSSMLVTANNVTQTDLTSVGGLKDGWVVEAQFYEIDIETNDVLFSWKSLDHLTEIPLNSSFYPLGSEGSSGTSQATAWGYFHINAVSPYNGGYVISSRFLCSAVAIDPSGAVAWILQGRTGGDFELGNGTEFCYQHDVRAVPEYPLNGVVTLHMHDNHNSPLDNGSVPSSGKGLSVNLVSKQVSLVTQYLNLSGPIYSTAQGNYQPLSNGNVFVGHGWIPVMEEFGPSGDILSTIQFGDAEPREGGGFNPAAKPTLSYRGFKQPCFGCPKTKPAVAVEVCGNDTTTVYVSWNGATEVEAWAVYGGASSSDVEYITTVPKSGFETVVRVPGAKSFVQVTPLLKANAANGCGQGIMSEASAVDAV